MLHPCTWCRASSTTFDQQSKHTQRAIIPNTHVLIRWNFTPSPGWTKEEVFILKLCLQKYGIGRWVQILDTGLLPGKLIQQLNGQTQRLLGQQSLAGMGGYAMRLAWWWLEMRAHTHCFGDASTHSLHGVASGH